MWMAISSLLTLAVMSFKLWVDNETAKKEKFDADKKAISDAVASGNVSDINRIVEQLQR